MKVTLIDHTERPMKKLATIASICYGRQSARNPEALVRKLYESGHHSVFEHLNFTFLVEGISRVCAQQLTRHRHLSFTMRSQRYTAESEADFSGFYLKYRDEKFELWFGPEQFAITTNIRDNPELLEAVE